MYKTNSKAYRHEKQNTNNKGEMFIDPLKKCLLFAIYNLYY